MRDAAQRVALRLRSDGILRKRLPTQYYEDLATKIVLKAGPRQAVELGLLSGNKFEMASVYNRYGLFGLKAENSIWHPCGLYASPQSDYSACNPTAKNPPIIVNGIGLELGVLTINELIENNYKTRELREWLLKEICTDCASDSM